MIPRYKNHHVTSDAYGDFCRYSDYQGLMETLIAIVNTAQHNPDRCMVDVCNDNFIAGHAGLRAEFTDEDNPDIRIEPTKEDANK